MSRFDGREMTDDDKSGQADDEICNQQVIGSNPIAGSLSQRDL